MNYDDELRRHDEVLRRACAVQPGDRVLDIGCGSGHTTRQAARTAVTGSAFGVDVSAPAIGRARVDRVGNVTFAVGDAQTYDFPPAGFDLAMSRFGTMFFDDPVAAFANIGRALRPSGRLVMMVWQAADRNAWDVAIRRAVGGSSGAAFSLADPPAVTGILRAAGFSGVAFADVRQPVHYGRDVVEALDWVRGFLGVREALDRMDHVAAEDAVERLREALAAHRRDDGVQFDSRAWVVSAVRTASPRTG